MKRRDFSFATNWPATRIVLSVVFICVTTAFPAHSAPQAEAEIPPDATPQIQQITPSQATPGSQVTVAIQGSNFSAGAYVSSVSAAIHVDSSKRVSATQVEAQLSIGATAQPSTASLLVSNPASRAAEAAFKIVAGQATSAPAKPPESAEPAKPAVPVTPPAPAAPTTPATPPVAPAPPMRATPTVPMAPVAPSSPATPAAPSAPAASTAPEVTTVAPARVGPGFDVDLKITGKNFVQGTKVSFANPGIRVLGVTSPSSTELTVHIKVASDAAPGAASAYVINPDDSEVEVPFEVTAKGAAMPAPSSPSAPPTPGSAEIQRYDAFHLGNPAEIFQVHGKIKGSLVVSGGTIKYQEDGKTLINISLSEVREIKTSSLATATFHITLVSGTTYHFAPGSLRPSDARNLVDALRKDLLH